MSRRKIPEAVTHQSMKDRAGQLSQHGFPFDRITGKKVTTNQLKWLLVKNEEEIWGLSQAKLN